MNSNIVPNTKKHRSNYFFPPRSCPHQTQRAILMIPLHKWKFMHCKKSLGNCYRKQKSSQNFYTKHLLERDGNINIRFQIVGSSRAPGNLRSSHKTWTAEITVRKATGRLGCHSSTLLFGTNAGIISSHNWTNRFRHVFAGLVFDWMMSLHSRKHHQNRDEWQTGFSQPPLNKKAEVTIKIPILFNSLLVTNVSCKTFKQHNVLFTKGRGKGKRAIESNSMKYLGTMMSQQPK